MKVGGFSTLKEQFLASASNATITEHSLYGNRSCGLPPTNSFHIYRPATDGAFPWPGMTLGVAVVGTYVWCTDQVRIIGILLLCISLAHTIFHFSEATICQYINCRRICVIAD